MRVHNFNAGPSALPLAVLEEVKADLPDWKGSGMSVIEHSHRGKDYEALHNETKELLARLFGIPAGYETLFVGGGATLQFAMVPLNLLAEGGSGAYVISGHWAKLAHKECTKIGKQATVAATTADVNFARLPKESEIKLAGEKYVHLTSNNTIFGTQYRSFPKLSAPMVCDMSSDIMSHRVDVSQFALIYAGAQKNLGPAGVTLVIAKKELLASEPKGLPTYLAYKTHLDNNSLYNTPPVFAIYVVNKVLHWIDKQGGLAAVEKTNAAKAQLLYGAIDGSGGYYKGTVEPDSRSWMNVTFRLPSEALEEKFIAEGKKAKFIGLKGHRSVGGIRVSMYNAVSLESIKALVDFMSQFKQANG